MPTIGGGKWNVGLVAMDDLARQRELAMREAELNRQAQAQAFSQSMALRQYADRQQEQNNALQAQTMARQSQMFNGRNPEQDQWAQATFDAQAANKARQEALREQQQKQAQIQWQQSQAETKTKLEQAQEARMGRQYEESQADRLAQNKAVREDALARQRTAEKQKDEDQARLAEGQTEKKRLSGLLPKARAIQTKIKSLEDLIQRTAALGEQPTEYIKQRDALYAQLDEINNQITFGEQYKPQPEVAGPPAPPAIVPVPMSTKPASATAEPAPRTVLGMTESELADVIAKSVELVEKEQSGAITEEEAAAERVKLQTQIDAAQNRPATEVARKQTLEAKPQPQLSLARTTPEDVLGPEPPAGTYEHAAWKKKKLELTQKAGVKEDKNRVESLRMAERQINARLRRTTDPEQQKILEEQLDTLRQVAEAGGTAGELPPLQMPSIEALLAPITHQIELKAKATGNEYKYYSDILNERNPQAAKDLAFLVRDKDATTQAVRREQITQWLNDKAEQTMPTKAAAKRAKEQYKEAYGQEAGYDPAAGWYWNAYGQPLTSAGRAVIEPAVVPFDLARGAVASGVNLLGADYRPDPYSLSMQSTVEGLSNAPKGWAKVKEYGKGILESEAAILAGLAGMGVPVGAPLAGAASGAVTKVLGTEAAKALMATRAAQLAQKGYEAANTPITSELLAARLPGVAETAGRIAESAPYRAAKWAATPATWAAGLPMRAMRAGKKALFEEGRLAESAARQAALKEQVWDEMVAAGEAQRAIRQQSLAAQGEAARATREAALAEQAARQEQALSEVARARQGGYGNIVRPEDVAQRQAVEAIRAEMAARTYPPMVRGRQFMPPSPPPILWPGIQAERSALRTAVPYVGSVGAATGVAGAYATSQQFP